MEPLAEQKAEEANWEYAQTIPEVDSTILNKATRQGQPVPQAPV